MRINPIGQSYNCIRTKTPHRTASLISFKSAGTSNLSKMGKLGYYALAILMAPFVVVAMLGESFTEYLTGNK